MRRNTLWIYYLPTKDCAYFIYSLDMGCCSASLPPSDPSTLYILCSQPWPRMSSFTALVAAAEHRTQATDNNPIYLQKPAIFIFFHLGFLVVHATCLKIQQRPWWIVGGSMRGRRISFICRANRLNSHSRESLKMKWFVCLCCGWMELFLVFQITTITQYIRFMNLCAPLFSRSKYIFFIKWWQIF